jgi:hypothetical protein
MARGLDFEFVFLPYEAQAYLIQAADGQCATTIILA